MSISVGMTHIQYKQYKLTRSSGVMFQYQFTSDDLLRRNWIILYSFYPFAWISSATDFSDDSIQRPRIQLRISRGALASQNQIEIRSVAEIICTLICYMADDRKSEPVISTLFTFRWSVAGIYQYIWLCYYCFVWRILHVYGFNQEYRRVVHYQIVLLKQGKKHKSIFSNIIFNHGVDANCV